MSKPNFVLSDDLSLRALRENSNRLLQRCRDGGTSWAWDESRFRLLPGELAKFIQSRYTDMQKIPPHSRMRHFIATGQSRAVEMVMPQMAAMNKPEAARKLIELIIISVLCDGGAGPNYVFRDDISGQQYKRSEALGLASVELYKMLTNDASEALTFSRLSSFRLFDAGTAFQVDDNNPLNGGLKRFELLQRLGTSPLASRMDRLGDLLNDWTAGGTTETISVKSLLASLIELMNGVWPARFNRDGMSYGDVFELEGVLYPFHKLTQWMVYSLMDALTFLRYKVVDEDSLTALPEYRNGGLLVDFEVLALRQNQAGKKIYRPEDPEIIEWRALTIAAIDGLLPAVRSALGCSDFSLAQLLEAGTWALGRELAIRKRPLGDSPIALELDGTVF